MNDTSHQFETDTAFAIPVPQEQQRMVEAVLFASREPLTSRQIAERLPQGCDVAEALTAVRAVYSERGVQLVRVGNAWAFRTAADLGFLMRHEAVETRKLSRAAVETLAIIAYHQPVTRAEIEEIRGVSVSSGTVDLLIELGWVKIGQRRAAPGRPMTLVVTQGFLDHFGLSSAKDLPGISELKAAGMLDNRPLPDEPLLQKGLSDTELDEADALEVGSSGDRLL